MYDASVAERKFGSGVDDGTIRLPHTRPPLRYCHDQNLDGYVCLRALGHTGRHAFWWRDLNGQLRAVWGQRHTGVA